LAFQKVYAFTSKMHNDTYPEIHPSLSPHAGHSVLITGSNRGCGRAMILSYARAGASRLALCSRQPSCPGVAAEIRAAAKEAGHPEPDVLELQIDVTSQADVDAAAKIVQEKWGSLDILINNSGYMPMDCFESVDKASWDEYEKVWQVNFFGTLRMIKAFMGLLLKGTEKTVLNSASIGALYTTGGGESYAISKFALSRMTEFWIDGMKDQVCRLGFSLKWGLKAVEDLNVG
jgi:NAD(P)-dependent dehydrogenase (short-subunit alcohol dehydrogenase family)